MNPVLKKVEEKIKQALEKLGLESKKYHLEPCSKPEFGDFTTNLAMTLSKELKKSPRDIAKDFISAIDQKEDVFRKVEIAGPGFINFTIQDRLWVKGLALIHQEKEAFGRSLKNKTKKAHVEFVSANPTGPLHIGHGRNAVVGDTLARLLEAAGYQVHREYYINDGGIQIQTLGRSVYLRFLELKGDSIDFPEDCYQGDYIKDLAQNVKENWSNYESLEENERLMVLGRWAGDKILKEIQEDLKSIQVEFDEYYHESELYEKQKVEEALYKLKEKNFIYEKEGATWLKSSEFGDDKDRVLIKNDGTYTYLTPDIAYHEVKFDQSYDLLINIWGADHGGYGPRLEAALQALGHDKEKLKICLIQMVALIKDGENLSMSTRKAQYETLHNVVKEVGSDVARYFFMMRSFQSQLEFDLDLAKRESSENPVYYIQYAYARISSILRKAKEEGIIESEELEFQDFFLDHLNLEEEISLIQNCLQYPDLILRASADLAPHKIAHYSLELARNFQSYYDKARRDEAYKVITSNKERSLAKIYLLIALRQVLKNSLEVLGLSAPESM